jgi:DNA-binding transcriptional MerR regulator/methylmalonyl-CoA mutase cobalamin-binding subunit
MASKQSGQNSTQADTEHFPIRTVSTLTGVNSITLRAWERRYGLVKPMRTEGGHRLYTRADIDSIHRILAMLEAGIAIGGVGRALESKRAEAPQARDAGPWAGFRSRMLAAIAQFDESRLEDVYNEMLALYPSERVTHEVLMPLLAEVGTRWLSTPGGVAEEHFFGVYMRNKLGARFHHRNRAVSGSKLVAACLPGEQHELGLLLFALAAHEEGFQVVLLGADLPLAEVAIAAHRSRADAMVLSGSVEPKAVLLESELPRLVREAGIPVFVGGLTSVRRRDALVAAGAEPLGLDIAAGLRHVGATLSRKPGATHRKN